MAPSSLRGSFGNITCRSLAVINDQGRVVPKLKSCALGGVLAIYGLESSSTSSFDHARSPTTIIAHTDDGDGILSTYSSSGKELVELSANEDGNGELDTYSPSGGSKEEQDACRVGFDVSSYAAAKAGLEGFTRVTASMGGPENIRVNAIRPRLIVNKDGHHWLEHVREYVQILEGKVEAQDIANTVLFLSSEDARYINAAIMEVGGGSVSNLG